MTLLLTCKRFLQELNDYLDDLLEPRVLLGAEHELARGEVVGEERPQPEVVLDECPNGWVICDTTQKTLTVYKGMEAQAVPADIQLRLMEAVRRKVADKRAAGGACHGEHAEPSGHGHDG